MKKGTRRKRPVHLDLFGNPIEERAPKTDLVPLLFEGHRVRVVMVKSEPWWVANDVCRVLTIANSRDAIASLDDDEKITVAIADGNRGNPNINVINESGLYSLIFTSRKPEAKRFRKWVTSEVLPSIRKTGSYSLSKAQQIKKRLRCDDETAKKRIDSIASNKDSHGFLREHNATVGDYADWHNAAYRGGYDAEAPQLRKALGQKDYETPLDRMSGVCLAQNSHAKGLALKIMRDSGREWSADERNALLESIAREMAGSDLRRLGPGYQYGIEVDARRGRILDAIQPQIEVG